jgi:hypothetical protein
MMFVNEIIYRNASVWENQKGLRRFFLPREAFDYFTTSPDATFLPKSSLHCLPKFSPRLSSTTRTLNRYLLTISIHFNHTP